MPKRSISVHLALMFALSALLIVSIIGILLRSSLHDSLQKQMHNELLFRESLMSRGSPHEPRLTAGRRWLINLLC